MAFRIKDLLINIAPGGEEGEGRLTGIALFCRATQPPTLCYVIRQHCPPVTVVGPVKVPRFGGDLANAAAQLKMLKPLLEQAVADFNSGEGGELHTVAEIEELQVKLRGALAELDRRKSELKDK
jgi:hypothetical protein